MTLRTLSSTLSLLGLIASMALPGAARADEAEGTGFDVPQKAEDTDAPPSSPMVA